MDLTVLPDAPTNVIFTGVAGTGKTHRLLMLQKLYDATIVSTWQQIRIKQLRHVSWCDAVCAVLLSEDRMMTVPEIMHHQIIQDKMLANNRQDNVNQTLWQQLSTHAHPDSTTVRHTKRSANYYFDKTDSNQWFLLDEIKASVSQSLADLLSLYADKTEMSTPNKHVINRSCLVSFHQSYGYEEFVEGIRPSINQQTGQMQYDICRGAFLQLCQKASNDPKHRYAMLIDEINRANTAQVFGELMSIIEPSKRMGSHTPMSVRLAYSGRQFSVPANVDIYATMNTQDYSLTSLDMAFRRRFEFIECPPDASLLSTITDASNQVVDLAKLMQALNQRLTALVGVEAQLGHSYFMGVSTIMQLATRLHRQVFPQILHHIRQVAPSKLWLLFNQVLYGKSSHSVAKIQGNEFCFIEVAEHWLDEDKPSNLLGLGEYNSFSQNMRLSSSFVTVAEQADKYDKHHHVQGHLHNQSNAVNVFITAKPYQQIYNN